jgi:hypothetical protein
MRVAAALLICSFGLAADVRIHLSTASGRAKFYKGDAIELQISFQGADSALWHVDAAMAGRTVRFHIFDDFVVAPADGIADPLHDRFAQSEGTAGSWAGVAGGSPSIREFLNEWISFRKTGRYTVTLKTKRVRRILNGERGEPVEQESNSIQIEIVEPPPGWAAKTLADARAVLDRGGQGSFTPESIAASRNLRFLETKEAVRPMAEAFARIGDSQLAAGLWGSPHRELVISTMEQLLIAPEIAVSHYWLGTLVELSARRELPVMGPYPQNDPQKQQEWRAEDRKQREVIGAHAARYHAMLLDALPKKRPQARLACALALHQARAEIPPDALRRILLSEIPADDGVRYALLNDLWPIIASPEVVPFLERLAATDKSPAAAYSRMMVLNRLYEVDPELGRRRILEEMTGTGSTSPGHHLFILPDRELPELDGYFTERLGQPNPPWMLIARYGTRRVLAAAIAAYEKASGPCAHEALVYFFRVDPEEAKRRLAERREARPGQPVCGPLLVPGDARELMSEGLVDALIADLANEDSGVRQYAVQVLGTAGPARAESHIWQALEKWRGEAGDAPEKLSDKDRMLEQTFAMAIINGGAWLPTAERWDRLSRLCVSQACLEIVKSSRAAMDRKAEIVVHPLSGRTVFAIGAFSTSDPERLRERLRQYQEGTEFRLRLPHRGTWYANRVEKLLREIFEAEGMELRIESTGDTAAH